MDRPKQLLHAILDASLDGLLALSESVEKPYASSVYAMWFPGWEKLHYNDPLDLVRDFYSQYIADLDALIDLVVEVRKTRELSEGRIRLLDGRIMHVIGRVIRTSDGGETEVWVHRDITEQCRQEEELQLRLQLITAVLNASNDAIFTIVEGLEYPLANTRYSSIFPGWEKALRYGQPLKEVEEFFSRYLVDWEAHVGLVAKVRQTGQYHRTFIHHKDGRILDMSGKMVNVEFIRRGALEIYTLKDITEEVRGRQKMQAMQLTVDHLSEPVVWSTLGGKITYVNHAAYTALGYDGQTEIIGKSIRRFYKTPYSSDGFSDDWNTILALLRKDLHVKMDHVTLSRKDGSLLPCTVLVDYITQDSKPFLAMCFHDLSEQIQRIDAERAAEAKSEFLARMSHEIRTPMNAIIGLSEMTQRAYGTPKGLEYVAGIKNAGKNLLAIINDILDFSKIESGRLEIVSTQYETASLLHDVLTIVRVKMTETPLELILDISPELPAAMIGDAGRIRQILLNLLGNAVKYTQKGFIKFSISPEVISDESVRLALIVEDSGIGIRQDDMPKLFDKFSRIDEKRHINVEGTGLGLVISRNLCQAMGGDITARSEYGKGSTFIATLTQTVADWKPTGDVGSYAVPLAEEQKITFTAPEAEVLIVDDFPSNLLVAEGLLAPYGMRVSTCLNGREAVELVRERHFDLILMDHMMPEMNGVEATQAIRAMPGERCRTTPIIALTANAVFGMKEMFLKNGFNGFISKPIDMAKLDKELKKWLPAGKRREAPGKIDTNAPLPATASETAVPEIVGLDVAGGIARIGGSPRLYLELLETFRRDVEAGYALLENEPDERSLPSFTTLVHALKSALANIGANSLSRTAALLEQAARRADLPVIGANLAPFREELASLALRIGRLAVPSSRNDENRAQPEIQAALTRLRNALAGKDLDAMDAELERLRSLPLTGEMRGAVSDIADFILTAEFRKAEEVLHSLPALEKVLDKTVRTGFSG